MLLTTIRAIEANAELTASEKVRFMKVFHRDVAVAEAYLTLSSPALRADFVKEMLRPS